MSDGGALQVIILRDGLLVGTEAFVPGTFTLGSGPEVDLKLEDPSVSARHAVLFFQNGRAAVQELDGAVNVNGNPVRACEVRPVDEITIGPFVLKLRLLAKRSDKPAPAPELARVFGRTISGEAPAPRPAPPPPAPAPAPELKTQVARMRTTPAPELAAPAAAPAAPRPANTPKVPAPRPVAVPAGPMQPSTMMFGQQPAAAQPARAPAPPPRAAPAVAIAPRPVAPAPAANAAPTFAVAPIELTQPKVRKAAALAQVEPAAPAPAPLRKRPDSLPEIMLDLGAITGPQPTVAGDDRFRVPAEGGKGAPRLTIELFWHQARQASVSVAPGEPLKVGGKHRGLELYGFSLPEGEFTLVDSEGEQFRLRIPDGARAERLRNDGRFAPAQPNELTGGALSLSNGMAARLVSGPMSLRAYVAPTPEKFAGRRDVPWLLHALFALSLAALVGFAIRARHDPELPDFNARDLAPVALRLMRPEKPKPIKPKPEKAKELAKKEEAKPVEKPRPVAKAAPKPRPEPKQEAPPPPEIKALTALRALAAGPAAKDVLAAVDKLGNGPGSKIKAVNYKLSGLVGKNPIAAAGVGNFGLGGGGAHGIGTLGAELLHGRGGGGIGAMGIGNAGHGKVAGTVSQAHAHDIAAQGNIDRDAVARTVNQHLQEVRACYERQLLKDPGLAGKVVLEWTISTSGRVVAAKTKTSTLHSASVESCILETLKGWQFPPAHGGLVIVSYPFLFNSVGY